MSGVAQQTFAVGTTAIRLRSQQPEAGARVSELLVDSGFTDGGDGATAVGRLTIRPVDVPDAPPADAVEVATHRMIRVLRLKDGRLWFEDGVSRMVADPAAGDLDLWLSSSALDRSVHDERYLLVLYGVLTFLRFHGLYPLHAGAVERDGHGCLIIGSSGSGKSSMAIHLVRRGWGYVADDSVALSRSSGGSLKAIGMRRDAYVREADHEHMQLEDWQECREFEPVKYRVPVREAYADRCHEMVVPRAIIFPSLTHQEGSRWIRCEARDALFSLLEHSSVSELEPSCTPEHVAVLRDLVVQARCYRLLAGLDLRNNPAALSDLMGDILRDATGGERHEA